MTQALVRRALESRLLTWAQAQSPQIPIAWRNRVFDPPETRYVRADLIPNPILSDTLDRVHRRFEGVFQVTLCMPTGTGPGATDALVSSLGVVFNPSAPIDVTQTVESVTTLLIRVYILQPVSPGPPQPDPERYTVPVSILYRADTI